MLQSVGYFLLFLFMQTFLSSIISNPQPQLIAKYVDKYLPNDAEDLKRIFNELSSYKQTVQQQKKSTSPVRETKKEITKRKNESAIQFSIRRSKSMIMILKQKGFIPGEGKFDKGVQIVNKQKDRHLKPLKLNPEAFFLKKGKMNDLCNRYQLNKQFYQNPPAGYNRSQMGFDNQMKQFIQKRKNLLKIIQQKRLSEPEGSFKTKKYATIQSRVKSRRNTQSNKVLPYKIGIQDVFSKELIKNQSKAIMQCCYDVQKIKLKPKEQENVFIDLQQKLRRMQDIDIEQTLKTKVKQSLTNVSLERYDMTYMNYIKQKDNNQAMSRHRKDLLKDQIKMRGIVDFQD